MKRVTAVTALVLAAGAGVVGVAIGQGTGATLGPKAQGSTTFQLRLTEQSFGVHCSNTSNLRRCLRQRWPRIASLGGGNGAVFQGDTRVGRGHFAEITTQRGRNGGSLLTALLVLRDGSISVTGFSTNRNQTNAPSAITGGTGAYAGARGFMTEKEVRTGNRREFRLDLTFTFIP